MGLAVVSKWNPWTVARLALQMQDAGILMSWGGLAVGARTEPRFTKDIDLAVSSLDDKTSESLVHSLLCVGCRVITVLEQAVSGRLATVRLCPPG